MHKFLVVLSLVLFSALVAENELPSESKNLQIGRYQMVSAGGDGRMLLLDTATGYVWKSKAKNNWTVHDFWELQIATPPEQPSP